MTEFWTGLIGVFVGGLVSFGTLFITNHQQNKTVERQTVQHANERRREAVATLLEVVSNDIAQFRGQIAPVQEEGSDREVAEFLGAIRLRIGTAADLARAVAATVQDSAVREASQHVYDAWYAFAAAQSDAIINETRQDTSHLSKEAAQLAPHKFYDAAQSYLTQLDVDGHLRPRTQKFRRHNS